MTARLAVLLSAITLGLGALAPPATAKDPAPPYWSVELGRYDTREKALAALPASRLPDTRVEQRAHGWYVRAGAYPNKAQAQAAAKKAGAKGRLLQVEHPVTWITAAAPATPATPPTVAAPAKPIPARPVAPAAAAAKPAVTAPAAPVAAPAESGSDLTGLELEQLLAMQVTGVTGRTASYLGSPAAIFVLTGEDIRRSGVRHIADALRMVPGLQVYRSSAQDYTVTSRGFAADKLQVLVDGRSVYSPLTSTTFWDVLDTYLEDIARIEVIRGPGATIWGANAVNGVINIVTKPAGDTQGTHVYGGGGNEERAFGGFRTGGRVGDGHGRAYVQGNERDSTLLASHKDRVDGMSKVQAGARYDGPLGDGQLTVSGDAYKARTYAAAFPTGATVDGDISGRDVALRWSHPWQSGSETVTSLSYDGYDRLAPTVFSESRDTYDVSLQHNMAATGSQRLTFGAGMRSSKDDTGGPPLLILFQPRSRTVFTYNAFVQDEIALGDWALVLGSKFEKSTFTDIEYEPTARLSWTVTPDTVTWASVSRATRSPNRIDHDIGILCTGLNTPVAGCTTNGQVLSIGRPIDSERLIAYEAGLRMQVTPDWIGDISVFANDYTDLRSTEVGSSTPFVFDNKVDAHGYGGEFSTTWRPTDRVSLGGFYSYLTIDARKDPGSTDTTTVATLERGSPKQMAGLRLGVQPLSEMSVDAFLRYVDNVRSTNVPNYTELNLRLGWQATSQVELSLVGENLLDASHPETGAAPGRAEVQRSIFAALAWRLW